MDQIKQRLERFLSLDPAKQGKVTAFLLYQVRLAIQIAHQLIRDNCLQQAASLSFSTILSLVPIVALIFSTFNTFANLQTYEITLNRFLQEHLLADSAAEAFDKIKEFSQNISAVNDIVSVLLLLIFSLSLFYTIEGTINSIWKIKLSRSFFDRFLTYWILVTLGPLLIVASIQISVSINRIAYLGAMLRFFLTLFPMTFMAVALIFTYKLVPNTQVRWKAAISGGILASVMLEIAKHGFNLYVTRIDYYNNIYQSLATLVFFLLWVYISWVIILFGTEVSYTIQNLTYLYQMDREDKLKIKQLKSVSVINDHLGLRVMWLIAKNFSRGTTLTRVNDIVEHFTLSKEIVEEILRRLIESGFLIRTSAPKDGLVPAHSLDRLKIRDIIDSLRADFPPSNPSIPLEGAEYIDTVLDRMETSRLNAIRSMSMAELLEEAKTQAAPAD